MEKSKFLASPFLLEHEVASAVGAEDAHVVFAEEFRAVDAGVFVREAVFILAPDEEGRVGIGKLFQAVSYPVHVALGRDNFAAVLAENQLVLDFLENLGFIEGYFVELVGHYDALVG